MHMSAVRSVRTSPIIVMACIEVPKNLPDSDWLLLREGNISFDRLLQPTIWELLTSIRYFVHRQKSMRLTLNSFATGPKELTLRAKNSLMAKKFPSLAFDSEIRRESTLEQCLLSIFVENTCVDRWPLHPIRATVAS